MIKQLVILAGGKGTRLRERLGNLPKPLIDVCGVPLLERQIFLAKRYGFDQVLILVNYQAEVITEFCRNKGNWGLDIKCIDDGEPSGTAGAVLQILDLLQDEFLVMYGDTMLEVDLNRFYDFHSAEKDIAGTLFLHPNDHPHDSDLVDIDTNGHILGFYPYPHDADTYYPNLVNAALYWIRKFALDPWRGFSGGVLDFAKHLFPAMLEKGLMLRGYNSPEYIKDCGTPARIDKVCADFISGKIERSTLKQKQMAVFIDRDGTLNNEVNHLRSVGQLELFPGVETAIRRLNQSEYRVCIITNQSVIARGECSLESLRQIHNKLETLLGRHGAFVDRIYYCPHHPDKGFSGEVAELKIICDCRKPNIGMIDAAISELNIAPGLSWIIGDSTADILTARNSGIKAILVETGYGGLDEKYWVTPDFIVPDLDAGVSLILDTYPALLEMLGSYTCNVLPGDLVFIGGQSRSGKSSCASAMRDVLEAKGVKCHVIATDRWLLNESERGVGVLARHNLAGIKDAVMSIVNPERRVTTLNLPGYRKSRREQVPDVQQLNIAPEDVIVFEGVVALHFARLIDARHQFFIEIEEDLRKQRVLREYTIRGLSLSAARDVYLERLAEEVPWVVATASDAVRVSIPVVKNTELESENQ